MDVPESNRIGSGNMEAARPSGSIENDSCLPGPTQNLFAIGNSQEIESTDHVDKFSDQNVDRSLHENENLVSQQVYDAGPSSANAEFTGDQILTIVGTDFSFVNESGGTSHRGDCDEKLNAPDCCPQQEQAPLPVTPDEAGKTMRGLSPPPAPIGRKDENHIVDIPMKSSVKIQELDGYKGFNTIPRTTSNFSVESATGDLCRICQQHTEEPVLELGCHCRGELARAHRSCIEQWFGNKGTNKCEVCQHVATNVPVPSSQPAPHFWVWRVGGGTYNNGAAQRRAGGVRPLRLSPLPMRPVLLMTLRRHPTIMLLWLLLFAFMAYLFVDVTDSASIGYAAMPIGFLFGVLVVLGLGTAARLVLECWHERIIQRNIHRMEEEPNLEDFPAESSTVNFHPQPLQGQTNLYEPPQTRATTQGVDDAQAATISSNMSPVT